MDAVIHLIAKTLLEQGGAQAVRIMDGGVDAKLPTGSVRIDVTRL